MRLARLQPLIALAFGLLVSLPPAHAQLVPEALPRGGLAFGLAFEPELVIDAEYLAPIATGRAAGLALGAGFKLPPIVPLRSDARIQVSLAGQYRFSTHVQLACVLHLYSAFAENDAGHFWGFGPELRCQPVYASTSYRWGVDLGWQSTLATHVEHSAFARRSFEQRYPPGVSGVEGPRNGWYGWTSQRVRAGLFAAHSFGRNWSGTLALGTLFALQAQGVYLGFNLAQLPLYLEVASRYVW